MSDFLQNARWFFTGALQPGRRLIPPVIVVLTYLASGHSLWPWYWAVLLGQWVLLWFVLNRLYRLLGGRNESAVTYADVLAAARTVDEEVERCSGVGAAVASSGRSLVNKPREQKVLFFTREVTRPTHYTSARDEVIDNTEVALWRVRALLEDRATGDLVRVEHHLEGILSACERCPLENVKRLKKGEAFRCRARRHIEGERRVSKFVLNENGDVVERS